jgi:hypothetical protein
MNNKIGILLFAGLLVGLYILMKNSSGVSSQVQPEINDTPLRLHPQKSYDNEEVREIEYNNDGLPTRITIHRHARAA